MRVAKTRLAGAVLSALLLLGGHLVQAQPVESREGISLQNEIQELRHQLQLLQRSGAASSFSNQPNPGGAPADPALISQLLDRVTTLEDQVRQLRGRFDELANQQQQQSADVTKQLGDLQFALQNGAPGRPPAPPPGGVLSPPPSALGALGSSSFAPQQSLNPAIPPPRTPEVALQEANSALARRDYSAAAADAREVLAKRGPRATDAQLVLAQAEQGQHNYQQAAPDFYDAYNRARTGPRAPDALLGVANSLIALNEKQSACEALNKLRAEFSQPRQEVRNAAAEARRRAACR